MVSKPKTVWISYLQPRLVYSGQAVLFVDDGHELASCPVADYCLSGSRAGGIYSIDHYSLE